MILFAHVHPVIIELSLVFLRLKSLPVLGNYTIGSAEYNGKLDGSTSTFTLLTISRQNYILVLWWATESKVNDQRSFFAYHKKNIPQSQKHPSLMGDYNFP